MSDKIEFRDPESASSGAGKDLPAFWAKTASFLGILLAVIALSFSGELQLKLGFALFTEQALHAILGISVASVFIKVRITRGTRQDIVPWYDRICAVAALAVGVGVVVPE